MTSFHDPHGHFRYFPEPPPELLEKCFRHAHIRRAVVRENHTMFFATYFSSYMKYPTAGFQRIIFCLTECTDFAWTVITAFRGSAKSTIVTTSFPIWAMVGRQQCKFILLVARTQEKATELVQNVRVMIEDNPLLKADLGPFDIEGDERKARSLTFQNYGAKIMGVSIEQSIRGVRFGSHRPDLIICDDLENLESVKTQESRDSLEKIVLGELVPAGDVGTRIFVVGNNLHEDSLQRRLQERIDEGKLIGIHKEFPLIDEQDRCLWPGKYPDAASIERQRKSLGDERAFLREYLLRIVTEQGQIIFPEWIQHYTELPDDMGRTQYFLSVDPAISEKDTADFTAIIPFRIDSMGHDNMMIHVLPGIVNARMQFPQTLERIAHMAYSLSPRRKATVIVEDVALQGGLHQELTRMGLQAYGWSPKRLDKWARLNLVSHLVQSGRVLFPEHGAEKLIAQLVGFGTEKHDDLADAFSMLLLKVIDLCGGTLAVRFLQLERQTEESE